MQDKLFHDPALVQFYDADNGWGDDTRYCQGLAKTAGSVLDLGCGTGLLAAALSEAREVWGVDPAGAMLDVARHREGGSAVTWVEEDARTVRLGRRFDLVVLTGHAFQCFLADADQLAVCQTIAAHLAPGGTFIFDSRNPAQEEWREWGPEASRRYFDLPPHGRIEAWNDVMQDPVTGMVTYATHYRSNDGHLWTASSRIRFTSRDGIADRLEQSGLRAQRWMGDWQGGEWSDIAAEIIPVGGRAV